MLRKIVFLFFMLLFCTGMSYTSAECKTLPTLGMYPFKNDGIITDGWDRSDMDAVDDYAYAALDDTGLFTLLSRTDLRQVVDEIALSNTGLVDPLTAVQTFRLKGAHYILAGNIMGVTARKSKTSLIGAGTDRYKVTANVSMRIINTETGEVIAAAIGSGTAKKTVSKAPLGIIRIGEAEVDKQQVLDALKLAVDNAAKGQNGIAQKLKRVNGIER